MCPFNLHDSIRTILWCYEIDTIFLCYFVGIKAPCLWSVYSLLGILETLPGKYIKIFCNHFYAKVNLILSDELLLNLCHIPLLGYTSATWKKISRSRKISY